ncbi:MAG: hypothetical protein IID08_00910 [Candidatus Hydrogenedentes bacterium]|nr:hypothetical protein [Candidatus Hydrogenedentota bacterium]
MDEFEQRKREVLQPIFTEVGAALFDCQTFEYGMAYLLYLLSRFGTVGLNPKYTIAILEHDEKKTAGQLITLLKKHAHVSDGLEQKLSAGLEARNELIHRYLVENIERMTDPAQHDKMVSEIRLLRSKVQKSDKSLEPFLSFLMETVDGIKMGDLANDAKAKFLADTRFYHDNR